MAFNARIFVNLLSEYNLCAMKRILSCFVSLACACSLWGAESAPVAFPGAEGFGMFATGGRGGDVYHVTTLEDTDEPGSLRHACNQSGPRTIVFDVSGTIFLKDHLRVESPDLTIAGQTAPGDGICVADFPFQIEADNVIVRFMRFRLGDRHVDRHNGDGLGGSKHRNIIVDHCSVSWSIDECISLNGMTDCTVQWCIGTHSLNNSGHIKGRHGYGGNWGGSGVSYHHNLLANHISRVPRLGPSPFTQTDERLDLRNNLYYNYGSGGCYGGEGMTVNIVNNYYQPGVYANENPERIASPGIRTLRYCLDCRSLARDYSLLTGDSVSAADIVALREGSPAAGRNIAEIAGKRFDMDMSDSTITVSGKKLKLKWNVWTEMLHKWGALYVDGNVNHACPEVTADNWERGVMAQIDPAEFDNYWDADIAKSIRLETPMPYAPVATHTADEARLLVLDHAGASLSRDAYDRIVVEDARRGTASFGHDGIIDSQNDVLYPDGSRAWPALASLPAPADSDGDGMPDEWEAACGLNPADASDRNLTAPSGYTYLEEYINSLVADIMKACAGSLAD